MYLDSNANVSNSKVNLLQCQNTVLMGTLSTRVFGSTIKVICQNMILMGFDMYWTN